MSVIKPISPLNLPPNPTLIFMGTPEFSLPSLRQLIRHDYKIVAVITQPDRPRGRGRKVSPSPVKMAALEYGIEVIQPEKVSDNRFGERIAALSPDIIILVAYGQILPRDFLNIPPYGVINIHASLLPKYRGPAPIQQAILNQEQETGLTIMHMDEGLDTGFILLQEKVLILPDETAGRLHSRLAEKSGHLIVRFLKEAARGGIRAEKQDSSRASYAPKISKEETIIPWQESAVHISAMIRAYDPFPGARTTWQGKEVKLFQPRMAGDGPNPPVAGRVFQSGKDGLFVETGQGVLEIGEVQDSGRKRMTAREFLRGFPIPPETRLGT